MGNLILWGVIILVLYVAYKKADNTVKMMEAVSNKQEMEENDSEKDV